MGELDKLNEDIRRYRILSATMPKAQSELDRLYTVRDALVKANDCPLCGFQKEHIHSMWDFCYCRENFDS